MSEISTVAIITAKPGSGTEVERVLRDLAAATHAEPGCLLYSLQQGMRDPDVFVTVEKWDSLESLESHLASDHLAYALAQTEDLLATAPQIIPAQPLAVGEPAKSTY
jgi:quinol monooxygenase YgiN